MMHTHGIGDKAGALLNKLLDHDHSFLVLRPHQGLTGI